MSEPWDEEAPPLAPVPPDAPDAPEGDEKVSAATRLVRLALTGHRLGVSTDGEAFAVPATGPRLVRLLRGGKAGLRAALADAYWQTTGKVATQQALADALAVLDGRAARCEPEPLALRVAERDGIRYLDLGDNTGRAVRLDAAGWRVINDPPVLFRRTALTAPLPVPEPGGDLAELWELLNVAEPDRPLVAAWLVAVLWPDVPHPVLTLIGEQGTGKTSAARIIGGLLDPSPVPVRKAPRDADSWVTAATGSWVVALDNLSALPEWLSDTLCRAATGDGDVRRQLYTDGGLVVFAFRRCLILTGIDLGALRPDLADRALLCDLALIPDRERRRESELWQHWRQVHPRLLGAVLDLAAGVAGILPSVALESLPRMADFAELLAAVDRVLGSDAMARYADRAASMAAEAVGADPFLAALTPRLTEPFAGTAAELLALVPTPDRPAKGWPTSARALTGLLKRQAPAMRRAGWTVDDLGRGGRDKAVRWQLSAPTREGTEHTPAMPATPAARPQPARTPAEAAGNAAGNDDTDARIDGHDARIHGQRETAMPAPNRAVPAGHSRDTGGAGVAGNGCRQSQVAATRPCGHPGDPATRCGTCIAKKYNPAACEVCGATDRPLDTARICDRDDHDHQLGRRTLGAAS